MKKTIILLALSLNFIFAITLVPLTETIDSKKKKNLIFKVSNTSAESVAVDVSVLRVLDTDNNKEQREETKKVSCYPTQFVLSPKESKSIRFKYMGSELPDIEEVYRVVAKELDIDVSDKEEKATTDEIKAQIRMRFSYEGLLLVKQPHTKAKVSIESFKELENSGTERGISLVITNTGNASVVPHDGEYNFLVTVKGKEYLLKNEDMRKAEFRRVLAGKSNTFYLKHIVNLPSGKIESIRLEKIKK